MRNHTPLAAGLLRRDPAVLRLTARLSAV